METCQVLIHSSTMRSPRAFPPHLGHIPLDSSTCPSWIIRSLPTLSTMPIPRLLHLSIMNHQRTARAPCPRRQPPRALALVNTTQKSTRSCAASAPLPPVPSRLPQSDTLYLRDVDGPASEARPVTDSHHRYTRSVSKHPERLWMPVQPSKIPQSNESPQSPLPCSLSLPAGWMTPSAATGQTLRGNRQTSL